MEIIVKEMRNKIRQYISFPIIIGIVASIIYFNMFGFNMYVKDLLSWTIGITIVSVVLAALPNGQVMQDQKP